MKVKVVPFDQIKIFRTKVAHCHKKRFLHSRKAPVYGRNHLWKWKWTFWPNKNFSKKSRTLPSKTIFTLPKSSLLRSKSLMKVKVVPSEQIKLFRRKVAYYHKVGYFHKYWKTLIWPPCKKKSKRSTSRLGKRCSFTENLEKLKIASKKNFSNFFRWVA